jgi:preprotein translocase subunit SecE
MQKLVTYIKESFHELRDKVTWPKFNELQNSSVLVLVASLIFSGIIALIDLVFKNGMEWFYGITG